MDLTQISIATITLARNSKEELDLRKALVVLSKIGPPIVVADGGSQKSFIDFLRAQNFTVCTAKVKGLVSQVKAGLKTADRKFGKPFILYSEPDKLPFFEKGLSDFVKAIRPNENFGMAFASRNRRSFQTFPKGQQHAETAMNEFTELLIGRKSDYCYGPLLVSATHAELAQDSPNDLGWGWRFFLLGKMMKARRAVQQVERYFPCPKNQRSESKADRIYRLKQLHQNLQGLFLGLELG
jgi:hypothetical protein